MPKPTRIIYRIEEYAREKGDSVTLITAKTPIDGGLVEYMGQAQGEAKNGAGRTMPIPFAFPIVGNNIEEAFDNYNEAKQAAWPEVVEQFKESQRQQASRIQVARTIDNMPVRGGNNKAIKIARQ